MLRNKEKVEYVFEDLSILGNWTGREVTGVSLTREIFEQILKRLKRVGKWFSEGRTFWAEEIASAEALMQKYVAHQSSAKWAICLEENKRTVEKELASKVTCYRQMCICRPSRIFQDVLICVFHGCGLQRSFVLCCECLPFFSFIFSILYTTPLFKNNLLE